MLLRASPHPGKRPAGLLAALAAMTTVLVLGATPAPAQAVVCETPGHAYLTQPGKIYVSGYEGKENFGIPRIVATKASSSTSAGTASFLTPRSTSSPSGTRDRGKPRGRESTSSPPSATTTRATPRTTASFTRKDPTG